MFKLDFEFIKILGCKTFGQYLENGKNNWGEPVSGKRIKLIADEQDIHFHSGFAWWDARLSPSHGTLEIRACGQQPPDATLAVSALALGLIENLSEAEKLYKQLTHVQWQKLRFDALRHGFGAKAKGFNVVKSIKILLEIAKKGLQKRNLREEKYLDVLFKRSAKRKNPSDEITQAFRKNGIQSLLERTAIRI